MKSPRLFSMVIVCTILLGIGVPLRTVQAQKEVTLSLWTHDQLYIDFFKAYAPEWEKTHPDYKVNYDFRQIAEVWNVALTGLAAGEPLPDLLGIEQGGFPKYMKDDIISKYFVDLTDRIGERRKEYVEGRWTLYMDKGRIYGVESGLTASVYYYQPAIFEKNGVAVPKTWEEFQTIGSQLGKKKIALSVMTDDPQGSFTMLYLQRGGTVFDKDGKFVFGNEANRSKAIEVLKFIKQGIDNGAFFITLGSNFWGAAIPTAFHEGRLAGIVMPDWYAACCLKPGAKDMAGQWRVAAMPVWSAGGHKSSSWGGTGFAISKASKNVDLVWDFLNFTYLTTDAQIRRFEKINMYPTRFEALKDKRILELKDPFFGNQALGPLFADGASDMPIIYQSPFRAAWMDAVMENLPLLFNGTKTPEQIVDAIVRVTQEAISAGS